MSYSNDYKGIAEAVGHVAESINGLVNAVATLPYVWHAASRMTDEQLVEAIKDFNIKLTRRG